MAKVAAVPDPGTEEAPKKGKGKLIIILVVLLLVLGGGGAGAYFFLLSGDKAAEDAAPKHEEPIGPPVFSVLDPFVVNLANPDDGRYLQIGITYELKGPAAAEEIKNYTPIIRSRILIVLSSKTVADLTSIEGKQRLMDELVDLARVTLHGDGHDPSKGVRDVHFSSFVIQ